MNKTEQGFDLQGKRLRGVLGVAGAECGRRMGAGGASTSPMLAPHPSPTTQSRALRRRLCPVLLCGRTGREAGLGHRRDEVATELS